MSRHRAFCFTWNNYPNNYADLLDSLDVRYIVAAEEVGASGTPHLQGYVYWRHARTKQATIAKLPGCHVEIARGTPIQADTYCRKTRDEDPVPNDVVYTRGDLPVCSQEKGVLEKVRWESALQSAKSGKIEEIPADILIRYYSSIRRIGADFMPIVPRLDGPCGVWIYGIAGSGKTRSVLDRFPEAYPKPRTRWWDGYQGEDIVYMDDVDVFDVALGGSIKLWSDAYPFIGEVKGGSCKIRPKKFIVTSQYQIGEIWKDEETRQALLRRFIVVEKFINQNILY